MRFHVITLFPEIILAYAQMSILGRAQGEKLISVKTYNPRDFTKDKWRRVDQRPYGGGPGMVLEAPSLLKAAESALKNGKGGKKKKKVKIFFLSASGKQFTNTMARTLAQKYTDIIFVSGRYEGVDARVKKALKAEEITVGPYVLMGGELPALTIIDAVARQIKGVLGDFQSVEEERLSASEVYTRPEVILYKGKKYRVPGILLTGNHALIAQWKNDPKRRTKGGATA